METRVLSKETVAAELRNLHVRCHPSCVTNKCKSGDCHLAVRNDRMICIKCDDCKAIPDVEGVQKPDFIVLYVDKVPSCWFVIELKSRVRHASSIVAQLQAGADIMQDNVAFQIQGSPSRLVPILVHGRRIHAADVQILARATISFRGARHLIKRKHCGDNLDDLVPKV